MTRLPILPTPKSISGISADGSFTMRPFTPALYNTKPDWNSCAFAFTDYASAIHGISFTSNKGGIELIFDLSLPMGHYRLDSTGDTVKLFAVDVSGIRYALATLLQIIHGSEVPSVVIEDHPDCDYRTLMIDLARQWHPFETLLNYVDLCFFLKIRYLHLHFIDDQRYTLPSEHFPNLPTEGESYTREQIARLVSYASERDIILIPEFEAPGHAKALVAACPDLFGCKGHKPGANIICAGKPDVFNALDLLFGEICDLFPNSPYIHVGGDEARISEWDNCPDCRAYMQANDIKDVHALYTDFVVNLTNLVLARRRTPIVWEGFPKEGSERISRDVIVISWENMYHYTDELLDGGFRIINACWQPLYITPRLSWNAHDILAWNVYNWQNWNPKSVAHLNPIQVQPTDQVWGAQLCVWEWNYNKEIALTIENTAAMCERIWSIRRVLEDAEFYAALDTITPMLNAVLRPVEE